jgi:CheY-like chemotaxis protein
MTSSNSATSTAAARILLVDDNRLGLCARKTVLEEVGYRITACTSGDEALEQLSKQPFDLVVTDYKMPKMDGLELIKRIRKDQPSLLVILLSGFADTLGMNEENTTADAVIQKSANEVSHLIRAVHRLLRRPSKKPAGAQSSSRSSAARTKRR